MEETVHLLESKGNLKQFQQHSVAENTEMLSRSHLSSKADKR